MQLSVLQWNVWNQEDIENIAKLLLEINADVVCLQELTKDYPKQSHSNTLDYVATSLGVNYFSSEPMGRDDKQYTQFNAIFSRFPLSNTLSSWINIPSTGVPPSGSNEFRAYIEANIQIGNTKLTIGTTHMSSYLDRGEVTEHTKQETVNLINHLSDKPDLIFAGDLNVSPESYTVQEVSKQLINSGPGLDQNTWPSKPTVRYGFKVDELSWRLDYVFAVSDLKVQSAEIIQTDYSDHLPILVTYVL